VQAKAPGAPEALQAPEAPQRAAAAPAQGQLRGSGKVYTRANGDGKRRLGVYFRPEVLRLVRMAAASEELDASQLVDRLAASVLGAEGPELLERLRARAPRA
jgi:hypothetical protein